MNLVWLRKDLRTHDNPALYWAAKEKQGVIVVFIHVLQDLRQHDSAPCQIDYTLRTLADLQASLLKLNIPLLYFQVEKRSQLPTFFQEFIQQHAIDRLFFNNNHEYDEANEQQAVQQQMEKLNVNVSRFDDQVLVRPGKILTGKNEFYSVFTPFKRRFYQVTNQLHDIRILKKPVAQAKRSIEPNSIPKQVNGFSNKLDLSAYNVGETAALKKLKQFCQHSLRQYHQERDLMAEEGTSRLSHYLTLGVLSSRQCIVAALNERAQGGSGMQGVDTWLSELIWREFYRHVMVGFPWVGQHRSFKRQADKIKWPNNERYFQAWCEGKTGVPLVDAAMRQLITTGWMHNRARMVVAMFLTKNLLIDWRWGEKFFMQHLLDGDFASNNGGWQWAASTGTDAAPYFRIMNPERQRQRFDPDNQFVYQYCPEYQKQAPTPLVNLKQSRLEAIAFYKKAGI